MDPSESVVEENRRLRRTMRDLVALSTLPAVWIGLGPDGIAQTLADVLLTTLALDLVYVRLAGVAAEAAIEGIRTGHRPDGARDDLVKSALSPLLTSDMAEPRACIADPFGAGMLQVAITRFGVSDDCGVLIAASRNPEFPTERDRLLLAVGANQTAIVFQRRRAEARVDEQREWLRVTLASIGDAVVATDMEGRVILLNAVAEGLTGWTSQGAQGKPLEAVFAIVDEQTGQPVENPVARVLGDGRVVGLGNHTVLIARDGTRRPIDDSAAPIRDASDRMLGVVLIFRDVTEQRRAERELRASEEKLRLLADTIPQLAWMARPDGYVFWYNRRWYEYTGTTPEQSEGWGWQSVADREALPEVLERWRGSIASGEPFDMVFPLRGVDGEFRPFLTRVNALRDETGRILYWFGTNTDVGEIRRMEAALREADRRKDEFLATLAHELRNPLAPVRNALEIMRMTSADPQSVDEARALMERQVAHMVRLIDDLMDVSRITRGKLALRKQRVELGAIIRAAVDTSRPLVDESEHELAVTLPPGPVFVDADPTRLAQVVSNLLNNAAKYTAPGGRIVLTVERVDRDVVVAVRDSGVGIPPEMLGKIFEMFTQVDRSLERSQGGLGIGLTLVRRLVELHGGSVEAHSDGHGMGSEFIVRLPAVTAVRPEPTADGQGGLALRQSPSRHVLVVDDNQDSARTLTRLLALMGHKSRTAHDGGEAIAVAEAFRPDLILLDIGLPVMSGYDVARAIRARPWGGAVMIAALTGWGQEADRRRSQEAGIDLHLVKPVDPAELEQLLAEPRHGDVAAVTPRAQ